MKKCLVNLLKFFLNLNFRVLCRCQIKKKNTTWCTKKKKTRKKNLPGVNTSKIKKTIAAWSLFYTSRFKRYRCELYIVKLTSPFINGGQRLQSFIKVKFYCGPKYFDNFFSSKNHNAWILRIYKVVKILKEVFLDIALCTKEKKCWNAMLGLV